MEQISRPETSDLVRKYLVDFSYLYPGIEDWYERIRPEFATGARSLIAIKLNGAVRGVAITRNGERAKLCHISISESERFQGLGQLLLHAASRELIAHGSHSVHVTTGEEVAGKHAEFFLRHGFKLTDEHKNRYRHGHSELVWNASPRVLLQSSRPANAFPLAVERASASGTFDHAENLRSSNNLHIRPVACANILWRPFSTVCERQSHTRASSGARASRRHFYLKQADRGSINWRVKF